MARAVAMCAVLVVVVVMVVLPSATTAARAMAPAMAPAEQQCNPEKLNVCKVTIIGGTKPSESCCSDLKEQAVCLCLYRKDRTHFINSPNARKTLTACGIPIPHCSN